VDQDEPSAAVTRCLWGPVGLVGFDAQIMAVEMGSILKITILTYKERERERERDGEVDNWMDDLQLDIRKIIY
jgi:hypothetical protein